MSDIAVFTDTLRRLIEKQDALQQAIAGPRGTNAIVKDVTTDIYSDLSDFYKSFKTFKT